MKSGVFTSFLYNKRNKRKLENTFTYSGRISKDKFQIS